MTPPEELAGCCILLADGHPSRRRLLAEQLRTAGAIVRTVSNGENIVLEAIAADLMGRPWDVILLRVESSLGEELEVGKQLRTAGSMTPVIGLMEAESGIAEDDLNSRCRATGCCVCVDGPVEPAQLLQVIARLWRPRKKWLLHTPKNAPCQIRNCVRRQPDGLCETR